MARRRHKWQSITLFTGMLVLFTAAYGRTQFTSSNDRRLSMLAGNWQSCRESDGEYTERIYDGKAPGIGPFELHMGPYREFALFRSVQEEHRDHSSTDNLLQPYTVPLVGGIAKQKWIVRGLVFEATLTGGSRDDCESWWVTLGRANPSSSH